MSDQRDMAERERVTLILPRVYVDVLDRFVGEGLFMERQDVIRAALRLFFGAYEMDPFRRLEGPPEEGGEEAEAGPR